MSGREQPRVGPAHLVQSPPSDRGLGRRGKIDLMDTPDDRWEIEQDEFGRPLIRHRHATDSVMAYVTTDADGVRNASCPSCKEQFAIGDAKPRGLPG